MVMTDAIHVRDCHYSGYLWKMSNLIFPHWLIMEGQEIELTLGYQYKIIRDIEVVGLYWPTTFCNFQRTRSSILALTRSQSCKMVMWGRVIQTDLVTWPFKLGSYNLHIMCKKDEGIIMSNFTALRAAVFPLSTKNLCEVDIPPPSVRGWDERPVFQNIINEFVGVNVVLCNVYCYYACQDLCLLRKHNSRDIA